MRALPLTLVLALMASGCTSPAAPAAQSQPTPTPAPSEPTAAPSAAPPTPASPAPSPSPASPSEAPPSDAPAAPDAPVGPIAMSYDRPPSVGEDDVSFRVPPGATSLSFVVTLNASQAGPYSVTSVVCTCDPGLYLREPGGKLAWSQTWGEILEPPVAGNATGPMIVEGPYAGSIATPESGPWTLELWGTGKNMEADFVGTISFR